MPLDANWLADRLMLLIPLLLSLSVHEWAHAWTAWRLGDDTAALLGRMTLNPAAHIDPIGTLLLPLLGVPFGWARPVPINPLRFRHGVSIRRGMMITAVAGPVSNLVIALGSLVLLAVSIRFLPDTAKVYEVVLELLQRFVFLNVILAAFNALPIPPLDGSRVMDALVPRWLRPAWESFAQAGPIALAAVILLPMLAGISLFYWPMRATVRLLELLLRLLGA
jgi:Zn-dependent protease